MTAPVGWLGSGPRPAVTLKNWELSRANYKSKGKTARVGCGAGFNFDNLLSNIALAESGEVDYLAFDNMTEGLGFGTLRKMKGETVWDPHTGLHFSPSEERLRAILPICAKKNCFGHAIKGSIFCRQHQLSKVKMAKPE